MSDNNPNLTYTTKGDYQFPNLTMEVPEGDIGKYGRMRLEFLKEHRKGRHSGLLLAGKLKAHLLETNERTKAEIDKLVEDMLETNPAPDKETDQMGWVQHMNMLIAKAEEIVVRETVYS